MIGQGVHNDGARSSTAVERNSALLPCTGALPCTDASVLCTLAPLTCCGCSAAMLRVLCTLTPLPGCLVATLAHSLCVCDLCRVRVLVRLSHPRPPDHHQHGCTVGVLPGPTRVLPMPRQYGIGRRAPTRAVLSCAASWCLVVRRPRRCVDCLVLTFCYVSSRTPPRHGHGCRS